jgi:hypothetical protein
MQNATLKGRKPSHKQSPIDFEVSMILERREPSERLAGLNYFIPLFNFQRPSIDGFYTLS